MKKLFVLDLFSGIGGFSLGLERTGGFETVAFCEIEEFPRRVLAKHWPDVPCYRDVRELTAERLAADGIAVDVICGGFPCQLFSTAARGRNNAANLWPDMARIIAEVRPICVIAENVRRNPVHNVIGFCRSELGLPGFSRCISAFEVGADHQRDRWWAIAHPYANGKLQSAIDAEVAIMRSIRDYFWGAEAYRAAVTLSDGFSGGLDEIGCPGNAVVPQIPELIGNAILDAIGWRDAA